MSEETSVVTQEQKTVVKQNYDDRTITLVKNTLMFEGASDDDLLLFLHKCTAMGVHPMDGKVHPMKFKGKLTFVTSIDYQRSKAEASKQYDGQDEPEYDDPDMAAEHPEWAKVKIYKKGVGRPFVGIARWDEFFPQIESKQFMWLKMPYTMLAKCAEAQGMRKAFPDELNKLYVEEEMMQAATGGNEEVTSTKPVVRETSPVVAKSQPKQKQNPFVNNSSNENRPSEAERRANRWINENQEKRLWAIANSAGIDKDTINAFIKSKFGIDHVYNISWAGGKNSQYNLVCTAMEDQPQEVKKYDPASQNQAGGDDAQDFDLVLYGLGQACGMNKEAVDFEVEAEFSCTPQTAKPEDYHAIIEHFEQIHKTNQ